MGFHRRTATAADTTNPAIIATALTFPDVAVSTTVRAKTPAVAPSTAVAVGRSLDRTPVFLVTLGRYNRAPSSASVLVTTGVRPEDESDGQRSDPVVTTAGGASGTLLTAQLSAHMKGNPMAIRRKHVGRLALVVIALF